MRTLIVVPCFDQINTSFAQSLLYLHRDKDDAVTFMTSSLIYDARNQLGDIAVKNNAEYIFWIDSDMTFEPDILEKLMESIKGKDIVSGLYFRRRPVYDPCIFKTAGYKKGEGKEVIPVAEVYQDYPEGIFEIAACGFGCVLMRTSAYKKVKDEHGLAFAPVLGFGEDISFCIKARESGLKVYCDSRIKCGHTAHSVVTEDTYKAWRTYAADKS